MTMFKTTLAAAAAVALVAALASPSAFAAGKVVVSPMSNGGKGNMSDSIPPTPTFQQIVGSGPVKLIPGLRGPLKIAPPAPACQSRVCLTGGG
jgi:hypothetical protein